jgi:hypothetical protein
MRDTLITARRGRGGGRSLLLVRRLQHPAVGEGRRELPLVAVRRGRGSGRRLLLCLLRRGLEDPAMREGRGELPLVAIRRGRGSGRGLLLRLLSRRLENPAVGQGRGKASQMVAVCRGRNSNYELIYRVCIYSTYTRRTSSWGGHLTVSVICGCV